MKAMLVDAQRRLVWSDVPDPVLRPEEKASDHRALETNELHQKCTAADVAKLVCFLASEDAGFITGQT